jgi:predicted nucleic acid-binding protein
MKVYLDNVIVCGRVRSDLELGEMTAVHEIEAAYKAGKLEIVTSREAEQDRTRDKNVRLELERDRPNVPVVSDDHRLLGIQYQGDHLGGFVNCPILTDVVDDDLLTAFKTAGLKDADARHLMYAVHNGCNRFVTTDPDFLNRRSQLAPLSRGLLIQKPSELAASGLNT